MFRVILMCLLTCCSSFMPLKQSESIISEDHTQVVEIKTRENYVQTSSGYYRFGLTDLFSTDFLSGLIRYFIDDLGVSDMSPSISNPVNNYVIQTNDVYDITYFDITDDSYYKAYSVKNIVMNKQVRTDPVGTAIYNFILSNGSPYDQQISINFYAQEDFNMRGLIIYGCNLSLPVGDIRLYSSVRGSYLLSVGVNDLYKYFRMDEKIGGFNAFIGNIFNSIKSDPYYAGYNQGYNDGFSNGYDSGEINGYEDGYMAGEDHGYQVGFQAGVDDTIASGTEAMTIFSGIMDVAFIPVNVFFLMFNYEVFGINIAGLVSALLTIAIILIIFRFIVGRKV